MATQKSNAPKVNVTKNYRLFERNPDNRPLEPKRHRALFRSMKLYGFLSCFPITCIRNGSGTLIVKEGQHRLMFAETLQLPVYWIETKEEFDIAVTNSAAKAWAPRDYAEKHALNGLQAYQEGLEFVELYRVPLCKAFALLAGTTKFQNIAVAYKNGTYKITQRRHAELVVGLYNQLIALSPSLRGERFLEACYAVSRVKEFQPKRMLQNAERCRDKLVSYSVRDAYLDMMETVYNFGRRDLVGLKSAALMALKDRSAATVGKRNKK